MSACTKDTIIEAMLAFYDTHNRAPISNKDEIPFSKRMVQTRFGNWNDALIVAGIPLNIHKAKTVNCTGCGIRFTSLVSQLKRSLNSFCSSKCAAINRNTGRPQTEETKRKISEALRARFTYNNPCVVCACIHSHRKRQTCSKECLKVLKQSRYKKTIGASASPTE